MEPQPASPDATDAQARRLAWVGNLLAVVFVLAVGVIAVLTMSAQLRQGRPDRDADWAIDPDAFPKIAVVAVRADGSERRAADAMGGKGDLPALGLDRTDRLIGEAALGVLALGTAAAIIRRAYPPRRRPIDGKAKWANLPDPPRASSGRQTGSSAIAAARLSAAVWGDHVARREERRTA